ncbi:MAG: DUF3137 domain-containing protein [Cytophagales bacterium]|nr:MAG: DUF3137 domain-containing protein [Cytophagales bacterium]
MSFLRSVFGPSKNEIWQQLAHDIRASYDEGSFWKGSKVEATVGEWTIVLDTHTVSTGKTTVVYTRLRAPYVNADGFQFKIYEENFFSSIGKFFGMQDVETGHPPFDERFIVQGNDESKLKLLLSNGAIRTLLDVQPTITLEVKDDEGWLRTRYPENVDLLYFHVIGVIKDLDRLKNLYDLFAEVLQELCRIGSAYKDAPNVKLE